MNQHSSNTLHTAGGSTDDLRISNLEEIATPAQIYAQFPRSENATQTVLRARAAIHDILNQNDPRLLVIVGPCSIHDPKSALEYAQKLAGLRQSLKGEMEIIMRVYFEKPRTIVGWKGLINDPALDGSFDIDQGLRLARELLLEINHMGVPAACEFLDMTTPQYLADLVSWAAIGARTTESQVHRELASGTSCAVGFKNGTGGDTQIAIDAVRSAAQAHHFLAVTKEGRAAIASTTGNPDCHVILRGGKTTNYDKKSVDEACKTIEASGLEPMVMIDASHANSRKNHENQPGVLAEIGAQIAQGDTRIIGVMAESHLVEGKQSQTPGQPLVYGQSITDACMNWETTRTALNELAACVAQRNGDSTGL